jgi:hypothetical protein
MRFQESARIRPLARRNREDVILKNYTCGKENAAGIQ